MPILKKRLNLVLGPYSDGTRSGYGYSIRFTIAGLPVKKGREEQVSPLKMFYTCRDAAVEDIGKIFRTTSKVGVWAQRRKSLEKARLIIMARTKVAMERGIKVLNTFEKHAGWALTKAYQLNTRAVREQDDKFYYVVGSGRWMRAPALFSLFVLLIRLGWSLTDKSKIMQAKSAPAMVKAAKAFGGSRPYDLSHMIIHGDKWLILLENFNKIFGRRTPKSCWGYKTSVYGEGINKLCSLHTGDAKLSAAFKGFLDDASN